MKIGLLLPHSVLYPSMGFDIVNAIKARLGSDTTFVSTNIGVAGKDAEVYSKAEQLIIEGATIIIAYINPSTAAYINPLFKNSNTLLFALDSGYHFPTEITPSNTFFISLQGTLCCRAAVAAAVQNEVASFAFTSSFYDAGYRSPMVFANAVQQNQAAITFNHITALNKRDFTIQPLIEKAEEGVFEGILASFCGDMTEDLFQAAASSKLFSKVKVSCSSFTAEEIWLDKIIYPGANVASVVPWGRGLEFEENKKFKNALQKTEKANVFSLLAWETAGIIDSIKEIADYEQAILQIEKYQDESPRGTITMNPKTHFIEAPIYVATIEENKTTGNCQLNILYPFEAIDQERVGIQKDIESLLKESNSWFNAYPCLES